MKTLTLPPDVSKLNPPQTIANYPELCKILRVIPKSGAAKRSQLAELSRYCSFTQQKHSFSIQEVFSIPLPKPLRVNSFWSEGIEIILLDYLARKLDKEPENKEPENTSNEKFVYKVYLSKRDLIILSGLCLEVFFINRTLHNTLKTRPKVGELFFTDTSSKFNEVVRSLCRSLENRKIVKIDEVYVYQKKLDEEKSDKSKEMIEADYPTTVRISEIYGEVLADPRVLCKSEFMVNKSGKSEVFYSLLNKRLKKELRLAGVRKVYKFGFTEKLRVRIRSRKQELSLLDQTRLKVTSRMLEFLELKLNTHLQGLELGTEGWGGFDFKEKRWVSEEEVKERWRAEWSEYVKSSIKDS